MSAKKCFVIEVHKLANHRFEAEVWTDGHCIFETRKFPTFRQALDEAESWVHQEYPGSLISSCRGQELLDL